MRKQLIGSIEGLKFIYGIIIPKKKDQKWVFLIFLLLSIPISLLMYTNYGLLPFRVEILDYDQYSYIDRITSKGFFVPYSVGIRHPFLPLFLFPVSIISIFLKIISGKWALHVLFLFLFYNLVAAFSYTLIYKYCSTLLKIEKVRSFLICLLFSLFGHSLILSFSPESFPLSMLGLLIMIYMTSDFILNKREIPLASNIIMFCFISGVTVTNSVKCGIAQLFQIGKSLRQRMIIILKSGLICLCLCILSISITYIIQILLYGKWMMGSNTTDFISSIHGVDIFQEFFCEPLLFHHYCDFFTMESVKPLLYLSSFAKITVALFYGIILFSLLLHIKEKIVLLLLSMFSVDILIHMVFGFGIHDSYIYCQHWFFICPLLIAFTYKKVRNTKLNTSIDFLLIFFIIAFAWNNLPPLFRFLNPVFIK